MTKKDAHRIKPSTSSIFYLAGGFTTDMANTMMPWREDTIQLAEAVTKNCPDSKYNKRGSNLILSGPEIIITKWHFQHYLTPEMKTPYFWRSLALNREGHLREFSDERIVISDDEAPPEKRYTSIRIHSDVAETIRYYAGKLSQPITDFVQDAVKAYIKDLLEKESQPIIEETGGGKTEEGE